MDNGRNRTVMSVTSFEDMVHRIMSFEAFRVGERLYTPDLLVRDLVIDNKDLLTQSAMAAAQILYWGREAARARRHHARVEAAYRMWRDRTWCEIKNSIVEYGGQTKTPTDAHVEKLVHMDPEYGGWRGRLDDAQEAAENAEAVHLALQAKKDLIQTQQRLLHDEAGGAYVVVEEPSKIPAREPQIRGE